MGPFAVLALLTGSLLFGAMSNSGNASEPETPDVPDKPDMPDTPDEPDMPDMPGDPDEPEEPDTPEDLDLGASFVEDPETGAVQIELGDDETGTLASIIYVDSEDSGDPDNFYTTYEARFYLVPEGVDLSDQGFENRDVIPGQQDFGGAPFNYELEDFEAHFGLELLGTTPLEFPDSGFPLPDPGTMRNGLPDITSNADVALHYLEATTDGDALVSFLNEDYVVTRNGVTEQVVTEDTTGTAGADWLTTGTEGLALDGGDGDDTLIADHADTTMTGGAGDDTFEGVYSERGLGFSRLDGTEPAIVIDAGAGDDMVRTSNATVDAGTGDDTVNMFGGEAHGGAGDDVLSASGGGLAMLRGEGGDDRLIIGGAGSEAFGGAGDDFLSVEAGATGFGDAGNDTLQMGEGGAGFGGGGDDLFTVFNFFGDEDGAASITGGAGADTIDVQARNVYGDVDAPYLHITDFDPGEDVLQIGSFDGERVTDLEIVEDANGAFTDIRVTYSAPGGLVPGTAVIRLDGTPGITEAGIVLTT